jgi:hypothetical protein
MNDINYHRYCDSIAFKAYKNKNTFLNNWHRSNVEKFNQRFKNEWDNYHNLAHTYYTNEEAAGRYAIDIFGDKEYKDIQKHYCPMYTHKFLWFLVRIPFLIEGWLCCGWKLHYNKETRHWEYGEYHMMSKLCCRDARITWWDKLRFKWITGYKWEEE